MARRGENIYKRKDGRWEARYVKEIALDGTKKYGSVYARTYQAVKEKQCFCIQNANPPTAGNLKITVETVMWKWLENNKNQIKKSTYQKYETIIQKHICRSIGNIPISLLTSTIFSRFTNEKLHTGNNGKPLKRQTVNHILTVLGMGLHFAEHEYGITCPKIQSLKIEKQEMRVLSVQEQQKLLQYLLEKKDIYSFGIILTLYTGLRIGELCALQWEDISTDKIQINKTLERLKNDSGQTQVYLLPPKTESSHRTIPIPTQLQPLIEQYRQSSGFVLHQKTQKAVEPRLMQQKFAKYIQECGLEPANFHALRHTFATRCVEAGFDIKTLSEILGHTDVKTTLNKYVHSSFALKQQNMEKLIIPIDNSVFSVKNLVRSN